MVAKPEEWKWSSYRAMAGRTKPDPSLTTEWPLGQFGRDLKKARRGHRAFIRAGIGQDPIGGSVRGQSLLRGDDFVDRLKEYLAGRKKNPEIPRAQRYADRPTLDAIFRGRALSEKSKRDQEIIESVEQFGYSEKEIADHLGLHYSTVCRIVNQG